MNGRLLTTLVVLLSTPCLLLAAPGGNMPETRFVDNGDGTITDNQTGLMWHQKEGSDGIQDHGNPHDADNRYTWTDTTDGDSTNPDGTAFTDYLARLNGVIADLPVNYDITVAVSEQLGGYSDWRLPTLAELVNLRVQDCNSSEPPSCLAPLFTAPAWGLPATTWSSTSSNTDPGSAWFVSTSSETAESEGKTVHNFVRAVRNIE
jgi:hypothetical protein